MTNYTKSFLSQIIVLFFLAEVSVLQAQMFQTMPIPTVHTNAMSPDGSTILGTELHPKGLIFTDCSPVEAPSTIGICAYDPTKPDSLPVISYPDARNGNIIISRSGKRVLYRPVGEPDKLYISDLSGANPQFVTQASGNISQFDLSSDERYVAYTSQGPEDDPFSHSLVVVSLATGMRTVVVPQEQVDGRINRLKLSPDGSRIAFSDGGFREYPDGNQYNIWTIRVVAINDGNPVNVSNGGLDAPPVDYRYQDIILDWSPDGSQLLFERLQLSLFDQPPLEIQHGLWVVPSTSVAAPGTVQGTFLFVPSAAERSGVQAFWSPNGHQIAYYSPPINHHINPFAPVYTATPTGDKETVVISSVRRLNAWVGGPNELVVNSASDRPALNPNDGVCATGEFVIRAESSEPECTLRAAIETLNSRARADSISFHIDGGGPHTISPGSPLPVAEHPVVIDATTQPGYNGLPLIVLNGMDAIENGFVLEQGQSVVRGFSIGGFTHAGVLISGPGDNLVEANHIGVNASGTTAFPNTTGILIDGSAGNRIGGPDPRQRNIVSGNTDSRPNIKMQDERTGAGILIRGTGAKGNMVQGNFIGTDYTGQQAVGNGLAGVYIYNAPENRIGGDEVSHGNVISANAESNVMILGPKANENIVSGNLIGTNADGTASLSESSTGLGIAFASRNRIGGSTSTPGMAPGNLISGNGQGGVVLAGINPEALPDDTGDVMAGIASGNSIAGNLIGTNREGTSALPNQTGIVAIYDAHKTQIGGDQAGYRNVISGNEFGIILADSAGGLAPHESVIAGNYIGTTISGNEPLGNEGPGIMLSTLSPFPDESTGIVGIRIGGTATASRNIVAGNAEKQIEVMGPMSAGTVIMNNYIGVLANGQAGQDPDNSKYGVHVRSNEILIGSDHDGNTAANVIGGNEYGILLVGNTNLVTENNIGTNPGGTVAVPNQTGVWVLGNHNILIENTISGNTNYGVQIGQKPDTDDFEGKFFDPEVTAIIKNNIGTNAQAKNALGNGLGKEGAGVVFWRGKSLHLYMNVLSGNHHGVHIANSPFESGTRMAANFIGVGGLIPNEMEDVIALPEFVSIPNQGDGVRITDGRVYLNNKPGIELLEEVELGNFIQNNRGAGVRRTGNNLSADLEVTSNFFFGNTGLGIDIGPIGPGTGGNFHEPPVLMQPVFADERARLRGVSSVSGDLQLYTTPICHPSGYGEGRLHLSNHNRQVSAGQEFSADISLPGNLRVGVYITALLTNGKRTSEFSKCMRIASEEKYQEQLLDDLADRTLELLRLTLELGDSPTGKQAASNIAASSAPARIYAVEFDLAADHNRFEGSALATDGSEITPNSIDTTIYWTLGAVNVPDIGYDLCVDVNGIKPMQEHERHILVHRSGVGSRWRPLDTTKNADDSLCAFGLTSFGDIAVGAYDDSLPTGTEYQPKPKEKEELPTQVALLQNYPNPLNPATVIGYSLPAGGEVLLEVYDMLGRRIATLVNDHKEAGSHEVPFNAANLASGVYIYRITVGEFTAVRRMTLVK